MQDLPAQLALPLGEVRAVVLETTGDVSVLQGEGSLDPRILDGVDGGPVDPTARQR